MYIVIRIKNITQHLTKHINSKGADSKGNWGLTVQRKEGPLDSLCINERYLDAISNQPGAYASKVDPNGRGRDRARIQVSYKPKYYKFLKLEWIKGVPGAEVDVSCYCVRIGPPRIAGKPG